jgi:hypothetical protein
MSHHLFAEIEKLLLGEAVLGILCHDRHELDVTRNIALCRVDSVKACAIWSKRKLMNKISRRHVLQMPAGVRANTALKLPLIFNVLQRQIEIFISSFGVSEMPSERRQVVAFVGRIQMNGPFYRRVW